MSYNNFTYHILLAASKVDGSPFSSNGCSSYQDQGSYDQSNTYIIVDCAQSEDFNTVHAELSEFVPDSYPSWMTALASDPLNCTHEEALAIVRTVGASGSNWTAPLDEGEE